MNVQWFFFILCAAVLLELFVCWFCLLLYLWNLTTYQLSRPFIHLLLYVCSMSCRSMSWRYINMKLRALNSNTVHIGDNEFQPSQKFSNHSSKGFIFEFLIVGNNIYSTIPSDTRQNVILDSRVGKPLARLQYLYIFYRTRALLYCILYIMCLVWLLLHILIYSCA